MSYAALAAAFNHSKGQGKRKGERNCRPGFKPFEAQQKQPTWLITMQIPTQTYAMAAGKVATKKASARKDKAKDAQADAAAPITNVAQQEQPEAAQHYG